MNKGILLSETARGASDDCGQFHLVIHLEFFAEPAEGLARPDHGGRHLYEKPRIGEEGCRRIFLYVASIIEARAKDLSGTPDRRAYLDTLELVPEATGLFRISFGKSQRTLSFPESGLAVGNKFEHRIRQDGGFAADASRVGSVQVDQPAGHLGADPLALLGFESVETHRELEWRRL